MYYFIPSWYGSGQRIWQRDIIPWYRSMQRLEFDDSIHQLRIFQGQGQPVQMLLPAYMPHARYFLHRQDLFETSYYSVFDEIQGIQDAQMQVLQLKDLDWEEDCDFVYTPFLVMVRRRGQLYAHVEFGIEGFISFVSFFDQDRLSRQLIFDDRGFVSSKIHYEQGQPLYQDYLQPDGDWRIREHLTDEDSRVEVNPAHLLDFDQLVYESMPELILEKLAHFIDRHASGEDAFVLASHPVHNQALFSLLPAASPKILSFFHERNRQPDWLELGGAVQLADLVLTDRLELQEQLRRHFPDERHKIDHLSPFDTRLQLGKSQQRREVKLFYQLDLDQELNDYAIFKVLHYVAQHPETELTIGLYNAWQDGLKRVEDKVREIIDDYLNPYDFVRFSYAEDQAENALLENQEEEYRYKVVNITNELSLIQELEYSRIIIDLSQEPHLYTQIAGISAGLPQINLKASDYVSHLENGYIISEIAQLHQALDYYLKGLQHWNQALIHSVNKIRANTGQELINKWEQWLKEAGHDK